MPSTSTVASVTASGGSSAERRVPAPRESTLPVIVLTAVPIHGTGRSRLSSECAPTSRSRSRGPTSGRRSAPTASRTTRPDAISSQRPRRARVRESPSQAASRAGSGSRTVPHRCRCDPSVPAVGLCDGGHDRQPQTAALAALRPLTKRSTIRSTSSGDTPGPRSCTHRRIEPSTTREPMCTACRRGCAGRRSPRAAAWPATAARRPP